MTFNNITLNGHTLHTGEVVGSIPTAPTSSNNCEPRPRFAHDMTIEATN